MKKPAKQAIRTQSLLEFVTEDREWHVPKGYYVVAIRFCPGDDAFLLESGSEWNPAATSPRVQLPTGTGNYFELRNPDINQPPRDDSFFIHLTNPATGPLTIQMDYIAGWEVKEDE